MRERWPIVGGTGHRQLLHAGERQFARHAASRALRICRDYYGTEAVISGMALGWDMILADAALEMGFPLHAHVPFPQQPLPWLEHERDAHQRLLDQAATVTYYGKEYDVRLLHARNDGMIRESSAMLAFWRPGKSGGGTVGAVRKTRRAGKPLVHINPVSMEIEGPEGCEHVA